MRRVLVVVAIVVVAVTLIIWNHLATRNTFETCVDDVQRVATAGTPSVVIHGCDGLSREEQDRAWRFVRERHPELHLVNEKEDGR